MKTITREDIATKVYPINVSLAKVNNNHPYLIPPPFLYTID